MHFLLSTVVKHVLKFKYSWCNAPKISDAWPVRSQTYGYPLGCKASPSLGWYQVTVLPSGTGTCLWTLNKMSRVFIWQHRARNQTCNRLLISVMPYHIPPSQDRNLRTGTIHTKVLNTVLTSSSDGDLCLCSSMASLYLRASSSSSTTLAFSLSLAALTVATSPFSNSCSLCIDKIPHVKTIKICFTKNHHKATKQLLPYGITQHYLPSAFTLASQVNPQIAYPTCFELS